MLYDVTVIGRLTSCHKNDITFYNTFPWTCFSSSAGNGQGLILRVITKTPCYNLFITYSISLFQRV